MISLIIPFGSTDPRRQQIFSWVLNRWEALFPDWEICLGSSDLDNFNRSAARNRAFEMSSGDIIVISDADTITTPENVNAAIDMVADDTPWVIAHNVYYSLTEEATTNFLAADPAVDLTRFAWTAHWKMAQRSQAGVLVMPREAFWQVGYDERFQGWGYEDNAFAETMDHVWGKHQRTRGDMLHLWHDPGENFKQPHIKYNEKLLQDIRNGL